MRKDLPNKMFYMARPRKHTASGKLYFRFYSRHPYPWFQASIIVGDVSEAYEHFRKFMQGSRDHMKKDHTKCDCCYHPRIR